MHHIDINAGTRRDKKLGKAPFFWALMFGSLYFLHKGSKLHFFGCMIPFAWLIYPFFARTIVYNQYVSDGRILLSEADHKAHFPPVRHDPLF